MTPASRSTGTAETVRAELRAGLVTALKTGDEATVSALRGAISAIDNAEAVGVGVGERGLVTGEHFAGTESGVGATEAVRRELTADDVRSILQVQAAELVEWAERYTALDETGRADELRHQAAVVRRYVGEPA